MGSPYTPSLDGNAIFGESVKMDTGDVSHESQDNSYAGLNGTESINLGFRMRQTNVRGKLIGDNLDAYAAIEGAFRSFQDGLNHVLQDTIGNTWPEVKLRSFNLEGDSYMQDVMTGQVFRMYTATLIHAI